MFIQSSGLLLFISSSVISFKLAPLAGEKSETIEVIKVEDEDKEREDDNDVEEEGGDVLSRLRSEKEGVKGDDEVWGCFVI